MYAAGSRRWTGIETGTTLNSERVPPTLLDVSVQSDLA